MPYTIKPVDGKFCIYKEDPNGQPMGEPLHCHPSQEAAVAQIAAIMASERFPRKKDKKDVLLPAERDLFAEIDKLPAVSAEPPVVPSVEPVVKVTITPEYQQEITELCGVFASKLGYEVAVVDKEDQSFLTINLPHNGLLTTPIKKSEDTAKLFPNVLLETSIPVTEMVIDYEPAKKYLTKMVSESVIKVTVDPSEDTRQDSEEDEEGSETCKCTECGYEAPHKGGEPCVNKYCPECGAKMMNGKAEDEKEKVTPVKEEPDDEVVELGHRKTTAEMFDSVINFVRQVVGFTVATKNRTLDNDLDKILTLIKEMKETKPVLFTVKSGVDKYRWVAISSSNYQDRDGEIVPTKALEKDVLNNPTDRGKLLFWHEPSLELGECDFAVVSDGFLVESGYWYNNNLGVAARKAVEQRSSYYGMSIGFQAYVPDIEEKQVVGDKNVKSVYNTIRTVERSLLPAKWASNLFTAIQTKGHEIMDPTKLAEFEGMVGKELASAVLEKITNSKKEAEAVGVVSKEVTVENPSPLEVMIKSLAEAGYTEEAEALKASKPAKKMTPEEEEAAKEEEDKKKLPPQFAKKEQATPDESATLATLLSTLMEQQANLTKEIGELKASQSTQQGLVRPSQTVDTVVKEGTITPVVEKSAGDIVLDSMTQSMLNRLNGGA